MNRIQQTSHPSYRPQLHRNIKTRGKVTSLQMSHVTCHFSPRWWGWTNRSLLGSPAQAFIAVYVYYVNLQWSVTYAAVFSGLTAPPRGSARMRNQHISIFSFQRWSPASSSAQPTRCQAAGAHSVGHVSGPRRAALAIFQSGKPCLQRWGESDPHSKRHNSLKHEHLQTDGGSVPFSSHHHPPAEDLEDQVVCRWVQWFRSSVNFTFAPDLLIWVMNSDSRPHLYLCVCVCVLIWCFHARLWVGLLQRKI